MGQPWSVWNHWLFHPKLSDRETFESCLNDKNTHQRNGPLNQLKRPLDVIYIAYLGECSSGKQNIEAGKYQSLSNVDKFCSIICNYILDWGHSFTREKPTTLYQLLTIANRSARGVMQKRKWRTWWQTLGDTRRICSSIVQGLVDLNEAHK